MPEKLSNVPSNTFSEIGAELSEQHNFLKHTIKIKTNLKANDGIIISRARDPLKTP